MKVFEINSCLLLYTLVESESVTPNLLLWWFHLLATLEV